MFRFCLAALLLCASFAVTANAECGSCRTPVRTTVRATAKVVDAVVVEPTIEVLRGVKHVVKAAAKATAGEVRSIVCKRACCVEARREAREAREARQECREARRAYCPCECEAAPFDGDTVVMTVATTN